MKMFKVSRVSDGMFYEIDRWHPTGGLCYSTIAEAESVIRELTVSDNRPVVQYKVVPHWQNMAPVIGCIALVRLEKGIVCFQCEKGRGLILPGGKLEHPESFEDAAKRELREEVASSPTRCDLYSVGWTVIMCTATRSKL